MPNWTIYGTEYPPLTAQPPPAYVAKAVTFNGSTYLENSSIICPNTSYYSAFFWVKRTDPMGVGLYTAMFCISDPAYHQTHIQYGSLGLFGFTGSNTPGPSPTAVFHADVGDLGIDATHWHSILITADTSRPANQKLLLVYLDDTLLSIRPASVGDGYDGFTMATNGTVMRVGDDGVSGYGCIGDFSTIWIAPGVSLLTGDVIAPETRRIFTTVDNRPMNPRYFPSGAILFDGDATTYSNNQGTGGSFSVAAGTLTNATSSPSG